MKIDYTQELTDCLASQQHSLQMHRLNNQLVWVRKTNSGNPLWRYKLLNFLAKRICNCHVLQAVYSNPQQAISIEARRLTELATAGILVPQVLAQNQHGLMMTDLTTSYGKLTSVEVKLNHLTGSPAALELWRHALVALLTVHQRQQYLSQAFGRNILVSEPQEQFIFIDFEEDPLQFMSLIECQVRDYLLFLHSTLYNFTTQMAEVKQIWQQHYSLQPAEFKSIFQQTVAKISFTKQLFFIKYCGRDGKRTALSCNFLTDQITSPTR